EADTGDDGVARLRVVVGAGESTLAVASPGFDPIDVRVVAGAAPVIPEGRLRVGDVLLYQEPWPGIGQASMPVFDQPAAGRRAYAHASIVVGRDHGETLVAEVLAAGVRLAPVRVSVEESY